MRRGDAVAQKKEAAPGRHESMTGRGGPARKDHYGA